MKRFAFFSAFLIIVFSLMAYGIAGSGAWFTDTVTIKNASITTGNIDLVVSDEVWSNPDLEPGGDYQDLLSFCVSNGGNYNMKWRGKLTEIGAVNGMENEILIRALILKPARKSNEHNDDRHDEEHGDGSDNGNTIWFTDKSVSELKQSNVHILMNSEPFKPNDFACFTFQAKMKSSADNGFNQSVFSANLQLDATQWISTVEDWTK